jgi:hypothetical protein
VLLGRKLYKATPPHTSYLGASMTAEERAAYEAPHPEIRVYPFRHSGTKKGLMLGDCLGDPAQGWPVFPLMSDALLRIGSKVELFDPLDGSSTALHSMLYEPEQVERMAQEVVEIRRPGKAAGIFCGGLLTGHLVDHQARSRLYTMRLARPYSDEIERRTPMSAQPGLEPLTVYYRLAREKGQAGGIFLHNRWPDQYPDTGGKAFLGCGYPVKSTAGDRIFKYLKLFDPSRVRLGQRKSMTFLGAFRLGGMPPHTAEVAVDCTGQKPKGAMHAGPGAYLGTGFLYKSNAAERIALVCAVGRLAMRQSDRIQLSITNHGPVKASASVLAGSVFAGEYRLEVV